VPSARTRLPDGRELRFEQEVTVVSSLGSLAAQLVPGLAQWYLDDEPVTPELAMATLAGEPYYHFVPRE